RAQRLDDDEPPSATPGAGLVAWRQPLAVIDHRDAQRGRRALEQELGVGAGVDDGIRHDRADDERRGLDEAVELPSLKVLRDERAGQPWRPVAVGQPEV